MIKRFATAPSTSGTSHLKIARYLPARRLRSAFNCTRRASNRVLRFVPPADYFFSDFAAVGGASLSSTKSPITVFTGQTDTIGHLRQVTAIDGNRNGAECQVGSLLGWTSATASSRDGPQALVARVDLKVTPHRFEAGLATASFAPLGETWLHRRLPLSSWVAR